MADGSFTFGSVCSGIEAASVAFGPLGWRAAWFSEIEPFPCAVLAHHYPDVPNLGDMTTLPARISDGEVRAPDLLCGGTPCQAFSVAGKRESLADARGNLSLTFCEIADAIDAARLVRAEQPCIVLWENVPGVLSTKDNAFGCFLAQLCGGDEPLVAPDGWTDAGVVCGPKRAVAWRVLDAQYFGLAQRRRRVFVVASARAGFDPAAVLFEFDGVRRDSAPRREAGKDTTGSTGDGVARCLTTGEAKRQDWETCNMVAHTLRGSDGGVGEDGTGRGTPLVPVGVTIHGTDPTVQKVASYDELAQCLRARTPGNIDNSSTTVVQQPVPFDTTQITSAANYSNPKPGDPCHPLAAGAHAPAIAFMADDYKTGAFSEVDVAGPLTTTTDRTRGAPIAFSSKDYGADAGEIAPTLRAMGHDGSHANGGGQVAVAFAQNQRDEVRTMEVAGALAAEPGAKQQTYAMQGMAVRRLTPRECERLQGFPDDYTRITTWNGWRKLGGDEDPAELAAGGFEVKQNRKTGRWRVKDVDGPRYKALGNSWAVPCVRWIGRRIQQQLQAMRKAA